jgi:hypothetical protein
LHYSHILDPIRHEMTRRVGLTACRGVLFSVVEVSNLDRVTTKNLLRWPCRVGLDGVSYLVFAPSRGTHNRTQQLKKEQA